MKDLADCIGIAKSTYARYEDGSAKVPYAVERAVLETKQIDETFMSGAKERIDARINKEFPNGFLSE